MINTPLHITNFSKYPVVDTYHPSVVYVEEGWCGHRFWMVQTPYSVIDIKPYNDRYELPCVLFSDDGIHWTSIPNNPIDDLMPEDIAAHNYLSDPHLILKNNQLELYYRYTILKDKQLVGNKTVLYRRVSKNGVDWSEREVIVDLRNENDILIWGEQIISPAIVWHNNQYFCWYIDASSYIEDRHVRFTNSKDGIHWMKSTLCEISNDNVIPWHLDVQYFDGQFQILIFDIDNQILAHYTSANGIEFENYKLLLRPTNKLCDYYSESLYRACSVKVKSEINIYISAHNGERCSIGLWRTKDFSDFIPVRGMGVIRYLLEYHVVQMYYQLFRDKLKPFKRRIKKIIRR